MSNKQFLNLNSESESALVLLFICSRNLEQSRVDNTGLNLTFLVNYRKITLFKLLFLADGMITYTIADYSAVAIAKTHCCHSKECDTCED